MIAIPQLLISTLLLALSACAWFLFGCWLLLGKDHCAKNWQTALLYAGTGLAAGFLGGRGLGVW